MNTPTEIMAADPQSASIGAAQVVSDGTDPSTAGASGLPSSSTALALTLNSMTGTTLHAAIADTWTSGGLVAPELLPAKATSKSKFPTFELAAFVAVTIDLARLPASTILQSAFTARYCSVAAFPGQGSGGGECLLAFELPAVETDASRYALLQAGLETRYQGARFSAGAAQVYYAGEQCQIQVLGQALDAPAVRELVQLGRESKEIRRRPDELLRSRVALEANDVVLTEHGDEVLFGDLPPEVRVFCLVHTDTAATALTFRLADGRPVLACAHCQRTYTTRDASNDYDFADFDQTVRALAKAEESESIGAGDGAAAGRQFDLRSERYLGGLPLKPGVLCVKSPKGSGKTEQLADIVRQCKAAQKRVLLIGSRRTLLTTMAKRLGLRCYIVAENSEAARRAQLADNLREQFSWDEEDDSNPPDPSGGVEYGGYKRCPPSGRFAISLDSLIALRPDMNKYQVVIIDEAEQVFSHLVGNTLRDKRQAVYHRLRHYLRMAESVILLDADLGMVTMDSLFAMRLMDDVSMHFILNDYRQKSDTVLMYDSQGQLVERLREAVAAGEKCYVATNSKNKAIELQKLLAKDWPDRRVMVVHSENSSSVEVQQLLANIEVEFERNIDVLIASPALGTGVDITFKWQHASMGGRTVVQHVFGLFMGRITTHMDMDQQLMRVRQPGAVHVWIDPVEDYFETDLAVIKNQLAKTVGETRTLLGYSDDGAPLLAPEDGFVDIWSRVRAANRGSKNRLASLFRQLRLDSGWQIEEVARQTEAAKAGSQSMKEGKELRVEERQVRILAAPVLDPKAAEALKWRHKHSLPMSVEDRAALERHWLEAFYCEAVSEELIELDSDGRMRSAVDNLECLLAEDVANHEFDKSQRENQVWAADLGVRCARASLLRDVLQAAGLFEPKTRQVTEEAEVEQSTLEPFVVALRKRKKQFESVFELLPRKDADGKRVQQLGVVLEKVGLRFGAAKESDVGGKKVRRYQLDMARLERLRAILRQRAEARSRAPVGGDLDTDNSIFDTAMLERIKASLKAKFDQP